MFRFLIDECVSEHLAEAIHVWNAANPSQSIDFLSVDDPPDLPKGSSNPAILLWAEVNDYIVLTVDYSSMPGHLANHLESGHHIRGILSVRPTTTIREVVEELLMVSIAGAKDDFFDLLQYIRL